VRQTGVKKGHLVEQALLHYLQALDELPVEYIIPPRIVVSRRTGEEMLGQGGSAARPSPTAMWLPIQARRHTTGKAACNSLNRGSSVYLVPRY